MGHVTHMEETRNAHQIKLENPHGKKNTWAT